MIDLRRRIFIFLIYLFDISYVLFRELNSRDFSWKYFDAEKIPLLGGKQEEALASRFSRFDVSYRGISACASPVTHRRRRAFQIVERVHVKITFITLCNQLVEAISLKA